MCLGWGGGLLRVQVLHAFTRPSKRRGIPAASKRAVKGRGGGWREIKWDKYSTVLPDNRQETLLVIFPLVFIALPSVSNLGEGLKLPCGTRTL